MVSWLGNKARTLYHLAEFYDVIFQSQNYFVFDLKEFSSFGSLKKKVLAILKFYFRMERAETKVSVHSSHHTPLENISGGFLLVFLGLIPLR